MIALIVVLAVLLILVVFAGVSTWLAFRQWNEERGERARIDGEVRRAERHLHNLASEAFGSMLDVARQHRTPGDSARQ